MIDNYEGKKLQYKLDKSTYYDERQHKCSSPVMSHVEKKIACNGSCTKLSLLYNFRRLPAAESPAA